MPRPTLSLVFLIGAVGLMLLPLIVPVGFSGGLAGRSSLFPAWAVAAFFYAVLGTVALLSAREVLRERRRERRPGWTVRREITLAPGQRGGLATVPCSGAVRVRVRLLDVKCSTRLNLVAEIVTRGEPPRTLGELVSSDGLLETELVANLAEHDYRTIDWRTTELETDGPAEGPIVARVEVEVSPIRVRTRTR